MKAVNVAITKDFLLDLFELSSLDYSILNVYEEDNDTVIFTFGGDDLPEVVAPDKPQRALIIHEKISGHIKLL